MDKTIFVKHYLFCRFCEKSWCMNWANKSFTYAFLPLFNFEVDLTGLSWRFVVPTAPWKLGVKLPKWKKGTEMSFRLFHTGKNTSFFPLYYFPSVLHGLLTDLATLSHHHCSVTMGAQAQKRELTLLFKNRFVVPGPCRTVSKIEKKKGIPLESLLLLLK